MFESLTDLIIEVSANFVTSAIRFAACKMQAYARRWGTALWRKVRADTAQDVTLFRSISLPRKAIVVALCLSIVIPTGMGLVMDDATPYAVQVWSGSAMLVIIAGGLWRGTQWSTRRVRGLFG